MNIFKFISNILPSFERHRLEADIDSLRDYHAKTLQPMLKKADQVIGKKKLNAEITKTFESLFHHVLTKYRSQSVFKALDKIFQTLPKKLDLVEHLIEECFAKDVTKESLTYKKAAILQYMSTLNFVVSYTSKALLRYLAAETAVLNGRVEDIDRQLTPAELKYLNENLSAYMDALKLVDQAPEKVRKEIMQIPDITADESKRHVAKSTIGAAKLDPLKLNLLGDMTNPIFTIRQGIAEYQVRVYKRRMEEKKQLELRILALKEAYEGRQDPKLAQHIQYSEGRLQRLEFEISKFADEATA